MNNSVLISTDKLWQSLNDMMLSFERSMQSFSRGDKGNSQVNYREINVSEAPSVILSVIAKGFTDFSNVKFYKGTDGTFKVIASNNDEECSIYFDKSESTHL